MSAPFELPKLPYEANALEPSISEKTISFHYGKHHQTYVNKLNDLVKGTELAELSLEDIIKSTYNKPDKLGIFNNAAQIWNHTFYWNSLTPKEQPNPSGSLASKIDAAFGDYDNFKKEFANAAVTQFGSGWAWLVSDSSSNLKIVKTTGANTPLVDNLTPLLTLDVWEHAYYLDYQNRRPDYVTTLINKMLNWEFAESNFS